MNVKEVKEKPSRNILALVKEQASKTVVGAIARSAARQLAVCGLAIVLSRVPFTEGVFPFGLAFIIGVPDRFSIAALIGVVVNNWIGSTVVGANAAYIGAVGVVAALRWILAGIARGKYRKSSYLPCLTAGLLAVTLTEVAILALTGTFTLQSVGNLAGGVALAGAFSYFYHISFDALKRRKSLNELSSTQKAGLSLAACTVLMAFYPLAIGPFSLGRMVCAAAVVFAAFLLSPPLDAVVYAAVAASVALCEPAFLFAGTGMGIAGVLASLFKKRGKAWLCLIFVVTAALFALCAPNYVFSLTYLTEILIGSFCFLVIPLKNTGDLKFAKLNDTLSSATNALNVKLDNISSSMRDVTTLLDKTVKTDTKHINMDELYSHCAEKVCRNCALVSYCWVKCYGETTEALHKLTPLLHDKGEISKTDFAAPFHLRCTNMAGLAREINAHYNAETERMTRIKNTQVYKNMIKKQFTAVCDMLDSAKEELASYKEWDEIKSKRIFDCAVRLQLPVDTASCIYSDEHRPVITVSLRDAPPENMIRRLTAGISVIVGTTLSKPTVEPSNGNTVYCFTERPTFNVVTATSQICAEGKLCGDVYNIFSDLKGNVHILLSDGMGTGPAAAREGTICCAFLKRLLESNFPIKRAAELANSALAIREDAESASTIDVLSFNVFDGNVGLFKAGAAPTFCLHGSQIVRLDGQSLPVGILENVVSKEIHLPLTDGDIIVMTSDGIQSEGYQIIEETLKTSYGATAEEICREILHRTKTLGELRDDVTVIVAKVTKHKEDLD